MPMFIRSNVVQTDVWTPPNAILNEFDRYFRREGRFFLSQENKFRLEMESVGKW